MSALIGLMVSDTQLAATTGEEQDGEGGLL